MNVQSIRVADNMRIYQQTKKKTLSAFTSLGILHHLSEGDDHQEKSDYRLYDKHFFLCTGFNICFDAN
ncbi:hypothetical protein CIPAW_15G126800 [Carya illinoinensis]|uniref:Uncharacterized protein n=1 Tax=Carya illinoinensis TaxID=32201 RepID=A0A8T1NAS5_CARIL|nr:hypothetical protein CIPAW_15G126800 [Carya illinoinensis]KAG6627425.1 hypothetical protein CIPAW_15G126800 [Carya illinoinensis]KAG6627426.1 hypothetical protein CIPAW_15G126800 [Carya illinoinensis]